MEDGEINGGFLGDHEMEERKALASAHGEGTNMSWVEAVLIGTGQVKAGDFPDATEARGHESAEDPDPAATIPEQQHDEPPPPGTAADHPPPSAAVTARREAALVHRVMTLLREEDDTVETLLKVLSKAAKDGVDVPRWLGHGRSSNRGRTPLMEACMQGRTACCAALADAACAGGRGLNAKNERGRYSALHYACFHGAEGAALELLVRGADPRLRNGDGETGLQSALANGRTECAELVRDFLRRPTFEPDEGPPQSPPPQSQNISSTETITTAQEVGVAAGIGGVAAVAPEVCRANTVFCLGRRRRRLGARVRHGRGLGVGVGTAAAEVGLGARRAARLHATNPCHGTPMEAFVLWSIASGQDPFHGEGRGDGGGGGGGGEEEDWGGREGKENAEEGKGSAGVWLDYYVRVYNASLRRWYDQQTRHEVGQHQHGATQARPDARPVAQQRPAGNTAKATAAAVPVAASEGRTYTLVVDKSKALTEGRRFELPCGSNVVIGRSQHLAGIVVKDEMVSKSHLRIVVSAEFGVRVSDLGSKHGAVITKPAPPSSSSSSSSAAATAAPPPTPAGATSGRPAGLGGKNPPTIARNNNVTAGRPSPPLPPAKQKFFPIPIPRQPEWVAGAHGDRISLGKTVMVLEREGGPEPPHRGRHQAAAPMAGAGTGGITTGPSAAADMRPAPAHSKPAAVISKGFTVNPNLINAIRSAEEMERARKRKVAASEVAATAATAYLTKNSKRARSTTVAAVAAARAPSSTGARGTDADSTQAAAVGVLVSGAGPGVARVQEERQGDFEHVSKGSMLLRRMGWTEGQGLGRSSDGHLQPVQVERRGDREGLGTMQGGNNRFAVGADGRISKWEQMRRRFTLAQSSGPSFAEARRQAGAGGAKWLKGDVEGGSGQ